MAFVASGCGGRDGSGTEEMGAGDGGSSSSASSSFGDLNDVCQKGSAKGSTAQGVADDQIQVGVFSDVGFTKNAEFVDAAKVFTSWCNDNGGVNGRKLVANTRDSKLMSVRQQMSQACEQDFALVGGGAALDGLGTKERLTCLLPNFPAQVAQLTELGADLSVQASPSQTIGYLPYYQFRTWLLKDAYPQSANAVGIINGDSPVTKVLGDLQVETVKAAGGTFVYNDLYPAAGVSDWTPYAQAIKNKGVKGLIFFGDYKQLAKLESVLTSMNYMPDWIDANNNAYGQPFLDLLGPSADKQNNLVDLGGVLPVESTDPVMTQLKDMYKKYAPDAAITLPAVRAISAWLLFAKSAASCGDNLTRGCLLQTATKETAWTAGGLTAPQNLTPGAAPSPCFNVEKATGQGWQAADFTPDQGAYRCNIPVRKSTGQYGNGLTLADVGKSMSDVQ
ncbi:ABC transporter substrate-binding protein [Gordonia sp. CPCC 205515]|uniref:ABC transporter substrate-binding protein n=1 Tax=Gordonia sp. CPCC 205515 TaxID=3140791 RepID=UPI003AF3B3EE